ncbi:hypothetical protein ACQ86G_29340 [Roseateles chitinivorans]|uniref:hypothetical protein n=1 Tax=Roseateles chitinivorans TaxID=2917965 RepID=UPI003D67819D
MLRGALETHLKTQVGALREMPFQDFVVSILYMVHGAAGFSNLRPTRDGGLDGIIFEEGCGIACYGPDQPTFTKQRKKITDDYNMYVAHWKAQYPNWRLFLNKEPSPDHFKLVNDLHGSGQSVWGLGRILQMIDDLSFGFRRRICKSLQIPEELLSSDFVQMVLNDLLERPAPTAPWVKYARSAPEIEAKVIKNYSPASVDTVLQQIALTAAQQMEVHAEFTSMSVEDTGHLKARIVSDFAQAPGATFEEKFNSLAKAYGQRYNYGQHDEVREYIEALLFHVFTQCLIGLEPDPVQPGTGT